MGSREEGGEAARTRKEAMGLELDGDAERKGGVDAIGEAPSVSVSLALYPRGMAPQGVLGLSPLTNHGASVSATMRVGERGRCPTGLGSPSTLRLLLSRPQQMNQCAVGGQPSSSLQNPPQLYSAASQPQFPLPPGVQQVLGAGEGGLNSEADSPDFGWLGTALSLSLPTRNMGRTFFTMSWCSGS